MYREPRQNLQGHLANLPAEIDARRFHEAEAVGSDVPHPVAGEQGNGNGPGQIVPAARHHGVEKARSNSECETRSAEFRNAGREAR